MSFDLEAYLPRPTSWFSTDLEYTGRGTAKFLDPVGIIEGPARAYVDRFGNFSVELIIEKFASDGYQDVSDPNILSYFFSSVKYEKPTGMHFLPQGNNNPCISLTISTKDGVFTAITKRMLYSHSTNTPGIMEEAQEARNVLDFSPLAANFEVNDAIGSKYFVIPLYNFLASFDDYDPVIAQHPLRVYTSPTIPENLTQEETILASINTSSRRVIRTEYNGEPSFIEPLPDFEIYKQQLESGEKKCVITSVMVGDTNGKDIIYDNWKEFKINDLVSLLSLATGRRITSPWLEIRDEEGKLIRRIHINLARPVFNKGMTSLGFGVRKGGIRWLIYKAQSSSEFGKPYMRAAISQAVMGGYNDLDGNIEDQMSHLFRGLDAVIGSRKLRYARKITEYLTEDIATEVYEALDTTVKTLSALATSDGGKFAMIIDLLISDIEAFKSAEGQKITRYSGEDFAKKAQGIIDRTIQELKALKTSDTDELKRNIDLLVSHIKTLMLRVDQNIIPDSEENIVIARKIHDTLDKANKSITSDFGKLANSLEMLISRVESSKTEHAGYVGSIARLLHEFGFPDAQICDTYFKAHPGLSGQTKWAKVVSAHRGKSIHEASYDWQNDPPNVDEIFALTYHLRDLLVRIILKSLNYDGEYVPSIWTLYGLNKSVDWVTEHSTAHELGYGIHRSGKTK